MPGLGYGYNDGRDAEMIRMAQEIAQEIVAKIEPVPDEETIGRLSPGVHGGASGASIAGNIPDEAVEPLFRVFNLCREYDFDASGEVKCEAYHLKWNYLRHTRVMLVQMPKKEEPLSETRLYRDATDRHIHASTDGKLTYCNLPIGKTWLRVELFSYTGSIVTCPNCAKAITG